MTDDPASSPSVDRRAAGDRRPGDDRFGDDRARVERAIRALQAGVDVETSFDFLFRRFSPALERQLIRWGAPADDAGDLNQETFQRIFRDVASFRGGDPLLESWIAWIWQVARTSWLMSLRARRAAKRPQRPQPLEDAVRSREPRMVLPPEQLDRAVAREDEQRVRRAIDELPEQELKCVILYYYRGLKVREIAVVMRLAQGTIKAHLNHARAKLKAKLGLDVEVDGVDGEPFRTRPATTGDARV